MMQSAPALMGGELTLAFVEWRGFHAFRRGLGTRLYNNGTPIETVAKVLRHGSGSEVTLKYYVEV